MCGEGTDQEIVLEENTAKCAFRSSLEIVGLQFIHDRKQDVENWGEELLSQNY